MANGAACAIGAGNKENNNSLAATGAVGNGLFIASRATPFFVKTSQNDASDLLSLPNTERKRDSSCKGVAAAIDGKFEQR